MQAKFIGDPNDDYSGPKVLPFGGVTFVKDKWTSVSDAALFGKLQGSNHFETAEDDAAGADGETAPVSADPDDIVSEPDADAVPEAFAPLDPDGDGKPGGSTMTDEKAAIIAELEVIPGAEFDRRHGVDKLRKALEAARFMAGEDE